MAKWSNNYSSMRSKLIVIFLLLIIVPIAIIGFVVLNFTENKTKQDFITSSTKEMIQVNNTINTFFEAVNENCNYLATHPAVTRADESIRSYRDKEKPTVNSLAQSVGIEQDIYNMYEQFAKTHPKFAYVYMATKHKGYIQWPVAEIPAKYDPSNRPYYQTAMANSGKVARSNPYSFNQQYYISTVKTITNSSGEIIGVQGLDVSLDGLTGEIKNIRIGENGYVILADNEGTIVADPRTPDNNSKKLADISAFAKLAKMNSGPAEISIAGSDYLANVYTSPETNWRLISLIPAAEVAASYNKINKTLVIVAIMCFVIGLVVAVVVARSITKPMVALSMVAQRVADGDLLAEVQQRGTKDEVGILESSIAQMIQNLREMIGKTARTAEQLAASAQQLTASADQSAQTVNQVASSITDVTKGMEAQLAVANDTFAVVEQMSMSIKQVAGNANAVAEESVNATNKATDGGKTVEKAITQMKAIEQSVQAVAEAVTKLSDQSKEIGQIVDTISGIAGQTNLLALNAAIEAARAGEQGRGFAVVAEEVRKLAEQSQEAARKIGTMIGQIQGDTVRVVEVMNDGAREVRLGTEVINTAGETFMEITTQVTHVSDQVKAISAAIEQMAAGSQQIVGSVKRIEDLSKQASSEVQTVSAATQEQAASVEEIACSSQSLTQLAQELQENVVKFRV
ncbi:methyl-accepting chemotaxis protein [Sporomusa malonica]|uniref:Methyl-accepting chemotaxis protein n=1 Tax=Sporomusa malonica TaxID=112901 RepID=A0A1W2EQ55_9FIRM|nr:methyl-accepting chemotaxis protein [Sporomusa malonica]SMD11805.1 methyl-accepting chemotaxis protein [Sporomusa malonica]